MPHGRWTAILLGAATALACSLAGCGPEERYALRFDGLYQSASDTAGDTTYWRYLRFTEQGNVLSVSSTSAPDEVAVWLRVPYENRGAWRLEEDVLRFSCTGPNGAVDYEGEVLQDALQLRAHSKINDTRSERRYVFFELASEDTGP